MKKVGIVLGSKSDLDTMKKTAETLEGFGVPFEMHILSAHRTPKEAIAFAEQAKENGFGVLIGAAGMAAHLAGVLASSTTLPVIAVPLTGGLPGGVDALYAAVQMPRGVPVACVAVGGAVNAALLACQMLALSDDKLAAKLEAEKIAMRDTVLALDAELQP